MPSICSFNPFHGGARARPSSDEEENAVTTTTTKTSTGGGPKAKGYKWASEEDKILLFDLMDEKDPERVRAI